ncbi:MAG TPA: DUF4397 domain-containing protein [Burkholderiaceae bacterium]|nr:DUF4397 domain-containing protein [Burkholderiaceae bacterium]
MRSKTLAVQWALALLAVALASCGGGSSGSGSPQLRVANAAKNAPYNFDVLVNSVSTVTNLAYLQATGFRTVSTGSTSVEFEPTGTTTNAMTAGFSTNNGFNYTVLALQGSSALTTVAVAQTNANIPSGQARLTFVGVAPSAGSLDLYITAPTAPLPASATLAAVSYAGDGTAVAPVPLLLNAGAWRIRATATGDATQTILYDSGRISLDSGGDLLLAILPTTGSVATFSLLSLDDSSNVFQIFDQRVQLRVGNFAPAVGPVSAYLDAVGSSGSTGTVLGSSMALGSASSYQIVMPASYRVSFTAAGSAAEISGLGSNLAVAASTAMSVFSVGFATQGSPNNLQLLPLLDNLQAPATGFANLRVVQLSPDVNNVNNNVSNSLIDVVVLSAPGTPTTPPLVSGLGYTGASQYLSLPAGSYTIALVPSGQNAPVLPTTAGVPFDLAAGSVQTLVISGCQSPGSGVCSTAPSASLQLRLLQD